MSGTRMVSKVPGGGSVGWDNGEAGSPRFGEAGGGAIGSGDDEIT